jgi:hypothetical protein
MEATSNAETTGDSHDDDIALLATIPPTMTQNEIGDEWHRSDLQLREDVQLEDVGLPSNVFNEATTLSMPEDEAFCCLCQRDSQGEADAQELHFCARLEKCSYAFHTMCLDDLVNSAPTGQNNVLCPLCKAIICKRRRAQPVIHEGREQPEGEEYMESEEGYVETNEEDEQ